MFLFIDGAPVILTFSQVEQLYYQAFLNEFPDQSVSITQWRGSYEYQALYPAIQLMTENGTITQDAINAQLNVIADINQGIQRPSVLHSRVSERFAELGYIATVQQSTLANKGVFAVCVDVDPVVRTLSVGQDPSNLIRYGYQGTNYGGLNNQNFDGHNLGQILCQSDYSLSNIMIFGSNENLSNYQTGFSVNWLGYGVVNYAWNASAGWYENYQQELTDFIVSNFNKTVDFIIENELDPDVKKEIANLIVNEMLPAGQHMTGNITEPVVISNDQSVLAQWSTPTQNSVDFKITLTVDKNSPYPVDTVDVIVSKFLGNFAILNSLGKDITPETYYQIQRDAPWASKIETTYDLNGSGTYTDNIYSALFTDKFNATLNNVNVIILGA